MKAKEYCSPYATVTKNAAWKVTVHDRIWHVPDVFKRDCEPFYFPGWHDPLFFGNDNPVRIEYCCGNGLWIANRALNDPSSNWVAIDMKYERVRKVWAKIKNLQLNNLIVINGEGIDVTKTYFTNDSIAEIFVNFPDPWPKAHHVKKRLINYVFANEARRVLKKNGTVNLVTDDANYSLQMIDCFAKHHAFHSTYDSPYYITERLDYGSSSFEELWRRQSKSIHYHQFMKVI